MYKLEDGKTFAEVRRRQRWSHVTVVLGALWFTTTTTTKDYCGFSSQSHPRQKYHKISATLPNTNLPSRTFPRQQLVLFLCLWPRLLIPPPTGKTSAVSHFFFSLFLQTFRRFAWHSDENQATHGFMIPDLLLFATSLECQRKEPLFFSSQDTNTGVKAICISCSQHFCSAPSPSLPVHQTRSRGTARPQRKTD